MAKLFCSRHRSCSMKYLGNLLDSHWYRSRMLWRTQRSEKPSRSLGRELDRRTFRATGRFMANFAAYSYSVTMENALWMFTGALENTNRSEMLSGMVCNQLETTSMLAWSHRWKRPSMRDSCTYLSMMSDSRMEVSRFITTMGFGTSLGFSSFLPPLPSLFSFSLSFSVPKTSPMRSSIVRPPSLSLSKPAPAMSSSASASATAMTTAAKSPSCPSCPSCASSASSAAPTSDVTLCTLRSCSANSSTCSTEGKMPAEVIWGISQAITALTYARSTSCQAVTRPTLNLLERRPARPAICLTPLGSTQYTPVLLRFSVV
mmetsp:Transcript_27646/g.61212  ORF Transcript_27646/g.61212 Transcript_27646/m.61212 type:complete len:317 (-) Transcript_27646:1356-2306(-)